jgi:molybdate transport system ATP-binding protein
VALGRSLIAPHDVLLLDEPLASLDQTRRQNLLRYIERIVEEAKVPVLYVSHDWQEITRLCDHALLLDGGSLVANGAPGNLR